MKNNLFLILFLVTTSLLTQIEKAKSIEVDSFTYDGKVSETKNTNFEIGKSVSITFQNVTKKPFKEKNNKHQFVSKLPISYEAKKFCDLVIKKNNFKQTSIISYFGSKILKNQMNSHALTYISFADKENKPKGVCTIFYSNATGIDEKANEINRTTGKFGVIVHNLTPKNTKLKIQNDPSVDYALIMNLD